MVSKKSSKFRKKKDEEQHRLANSNQNEIQQDFLQSMMVQKRFGKNQKITVMEVVENTLWITVILIFLQNFHLLAPLSHE